MDYTNFKKELESESVEFWINYNYNNGTCWDDIYTEEEMKEDYSVSILDKRFLYRREE